MGSFISCIASNSSISCVSIVLSYIVLRNWIYPKTHHNNNGYPIVPSCVPILGSALKFRKGKTTFLLNCRRLYGSIFNMNLLGSNFIVLTDHSYFPVVNKSSELSLRPLKTKLIHNVFGAVDSDNIPLKAQDAIAKQLRNHFAKYLRGNPLELLNNDCLHNFHNLFIQDKLQRNHNSNNSFPLLSWLSHLIFQTTVKTFYGDGLISESLEVNMNKLDKAFTTLCCGIPAKLIGISKPRESLHEDITVFLNSNAREYVSQLVSDRVNLYDEFNISSTDKAAHHTSFIWAMNFNTIKTTFWTIYFLLSDHAAWQKVKEEIVQNLPFSEKLNWTRDSLAR